MKKSKIILIILAAALLTALTAFAVSSADDVMMTFDKGTADEVTNMPQTEALSSEYIVPDNIPEREGYEFLYWKLDYEAITSYTVFYLEEGTEQPLCDPIIGYEAAFATVTERAAAIDRYDLVGEQEQSIVLAPDAYKNVFKFYYKKHAVPTMYTIVCCDNMGEVIYSDSFEGYSGESVAISAPVLEHYELSAESPSSVDIELSEYEDENVFCFRYDPQIIMYTVRHLEYYGRTDIVEPVVKFVSYNATVIESCLDDARAWGYSARDTKPKKVTINEEGMEIIFYYYLLS